MIKKAVLLLFTFTALCGSYLAYHQGFELLTAYLAEDRGNSDAYVFDNASESSIRSNRLALEEFGTGHWTTDDVKLTYYDQSRGFYMYGQNYERLDGGKLLRIKPFALISDAKGGGSRKTITCDVAEVRFSGPFGFVKPGNNEPNKVVSGEMVGNVRIRDDKGTPADPGDDLRIGPMTQLEYEEKSLQIRSKSDIVIQDRDMTITGTEMMIQLRRKLAAIVSSEPTAAPGAMPGGPTTADGNGFEAEFAELYRNVHIMVHDVTPSGILPGSSKPDAKGRTPLRLWCDGLMRIDLPKPAPAVLVGPPHLDREPDPTFARFEKNVRVLRGLTNPDRLNSSMLYLTLRPDPKPAIQPKDVAAVAVADAATAIGGNPEAAIGLGAAENVAGQATATGSKGPLTELKLRAARATGEVVTILSESQGVRARGIELKYEKHLEEGQPDRTYLNGGVNRKLVVEKVEYHREGPLAGQVRSVLMLQSLDATIFDYGPQATSRIVARGPGKAEERPDRNASVARVAWFEDSMELRTWHDLVAAGPAPGAAPTDRQVAPSSLTVTSAGYAGKPAAAPKAVQGPLRRLITLAGPSKLVDFKTSATLDAREKIVAEFETENKPDGPSPAPAPAPASAVSPMSTDGSTRIKWLQAFQDVHLSSPGKVLTARDKLDAVFLQPEPGAPIIAATPSPAPAPASAAPQPNLAANPPGDPPLPVSRPDAPPAKPEGAVDARADYVFATIVQNGADGKGEVRDAKLRGGVMLHQEPIPGERFGKDASGAALDLFNQGKGMMKFAISTEEPQASRSLDGTTRVVGSGGSTPSASLANDGKGNARSVLTSKSRPATPRQLCRVEFDGKVIESERIIGLDQLNHFAWAMGHGSLVQKADVGLLDDKGLLADRPKGGKKGGPAPRENLTITWNEEMRFFGKSKDPEGRDVAKVEFRGKSERVRTPDGRAIDRRGVEALMTNSAIYCDEMDVYMDKTIDFAKAKQGPGGSIVNAEDVAPSAEDEGKQAEIALIDSRGQDRIENGLMIPGVDVISRELFPDTGFYKNKYRIRHTRVVYDKRTGAFEAGGPGTVFLYKGEAKDRPSTSTAVAKAVEKAGKRGKEVVSTVRDQPTLKLTKITFNEGMRGRFGISRDKSIKESREAEFVGGVQAADLVVAGPSSDVDFDQLDRMPDAVFLTSDVLRVRTEPPVAREPDAPDRQFLLTQGNSVLRTTNVLITGDRITYDSSTDLGYVYGDDDREVVVSQQVGVGQVANVTRGSSARFDRTTRAGQIMDPHAIQFYDVKSGNRPAPFGPDLHGGYKKVDPQKAQRKTFQRPSKNSTERNSFSGH